VGLDVYLFNQAEDWQTPIYHGWVPDVCREMPYGISLEYLLWEFRQTSFSPTPESVCMHRLAVRAGQMIGPLCRAVDGLDSQYKVNTSTPTLSNYDIFASFISDFLDAVVANPNAYVLYVNGW